MKRLSLARFAEEFYFPSLCFGCRAPCSGAFCEACRKKLDEAFAPASFLCPGGNAFADRAFALFEYGEYPVKEMILAMKGLNSTALSDTVKEYLRALPPKTVFPEKPDLISFCPRRYSARRKAGFDQAETLAALCGALWDVPVEKLLLRRGISLAQHALSAESRRKNVRGKFLAARSLNGESVLLVDDVITTGSTVKEAARVLKKAGAMHVYVLALSRQS